MAEFEKQIGQFAYSGASEKSYVDKLLSKKEVELLKQFMGTEDLTKKQLGIMMHTITSIEVKLANFNEMDRYILGKFFIWIREFIMLSEFTYDYVERLQGIKKGNTVILQPYHFQSKETGEIIIETIQNIKVQQLHNLKFLIDLYLYLLRSTMALGSVTFDSLSKSRYEYEYEPSQMPPAEAPQAQAKSGGWFRR
jgi:hypothetical protein